MSVGAAIGVDANRMGEVERCLMKCGVFEMRTGTLLVAEGSTRLIGMRRTSLGSVRESMSGFLVYLVRCKRCKVVNVDGSVVLNN